MTVAQINATAKSEKQLMIPVERIRPILEQQVRLHATGQPTSSGWGGGFQATCREIAATLGRSEDGVARRLNGILGGRGSHGFRKPKQPDVPASRMMVDHLRQEGRYQEALDLQAAQSGKGDGSEIVLTAGVAFEIAKTTMRDVVQVEFNTADMFLTGLGLQDLWNDELADLLDGQLEDMPDDEDGLPDGEVEERPCVRCRRDIDWSRGDAGDRESGTCALCYAKENPGLRWSVWTRAELYQLYERYVLQDLTLQELVADIWREKGYGSHAGCASSVRQAWQRNRWPQRQRGESNRLSNARKGPRLAAHRKLSEQDARDLHPQHWDDWLSINELARLNHERLGLTRSALSSQLSYTWKLLGLPVHDRIEMTRRASTKNGLSPRSHKERSKRRRAAGLTVHEAAPRRDGCAGLSKRGRPCRSQSAGDSTFCFIHDPENRRRIDDQLAMMRSRRLVPGKLEPIDRLQKELRSFFERTGSWTALSEATGVNRSYLSKLSKTQQTRQIDRQYAERLRAAISKLSVTDTRLAA